MYDLLSYWTWVLYQVATFLFLQLPPQHSFHSVEENVKQWDSNTNMIYGLFGISNKQADNFSFSLPYLLGTDHAVAPMK